MKFESLLLGTLFVACFGICALVMGAMLTATPTSGRVTRATDPVVGVAVAKVDCAARRIDTLRCAGGNG